MKHLAIYEDYSLFESDSSGGNLFDFFPFDNSAKPKPSGLPDQINLEGLEKLKDSKIPDSTWKSGKGSGIYITMVKTPDEGIFRAMVRSIDPLTFDIDFFNSDFKLKESFHGLNRESIKNIFKTPGGLKILSDMRVAFPELHSYFDSGKGKYQLGADLGDLYF